jgi:hypothetical protein
MATRGTISVVMQDGSVSTVYSHWDNYIECNGKILQEHYNTIEKARELVSYGSISSLAPNIGEAHNFDERSDTDCTFYSRDRNEPLNIKTFNSIEDYQNHIETGGGEEYDYIMTEDGVWSVYFNDDWHDLEYIIQEQYQDAA